MNTLHGMVVDDTYITDSEEPGLLGKMDPARRARIRAGFRKVVKGIALAPLLMLPGGKSVALTYAAVKAAKKKVIANRAAKAAKAAAQSAAEAAQTVQQVQAAPAIDPASYQQPIQQQQYYNPQPAQQYSPQPAQQFNPQPAQQYYPEPAQYPEPQPAQDYDPEPAEYQQQDSDQSEIQSQDDEMYGMDKKVVLWGSAAVIGLIGYYAYKKGWLK
jgi:hypothetical protein